MLIASMVGLDNRATMDIDTTIRNYNLTAEDAGKMIEDIIDVFPLTIEYGLQLKVPKALWMKQ